MSSKEDFEKHDHHIRDSRKNQIKHKPIWKWVIRVIVLGLIGLLGFQAFTIINANSALLRNVVSTSTPSVSITPDIEIQRTGYQTQTEKGVKSFKHFTGLQAESDAIALDFSSKFFTMSNLSKQNDFLGMEYVYENAEVQKNFRAFALTNFYYRFPEMLEKYTASGMPEIELVAVESSEKTVYTHTTPDLIDGYRFSNANSLGKDEAFMKRAFNGYTYKLKLNYKTTPSTSLWLPLAPDLLNLTLLFDEETTKWFVAQFNTTSSTYVPEEETPSTYVPEEETPSTYAPEEETPSTYAPEEETPSTYAPEEETPSTYAPEEEAPSTYVPEEETPSGVV